MASVCVIDDDALLRASLCALLKREGHVVISASNAQDGLEIVESCSLVITDLQMPGMSGLDFILHVRRLYPDAKIIAMSGNADAESLLDDARISLDAFLAKPFRPKALLEAVQAAIA